MMVIWDITNCHSGIRDITKVMWDITICQNSIRVITNGNSIIKNIYSADSVQIYRMIISEH